jgi:hypothetical protein
MRTFIGSIFFKILRSLTPYRFLSDYRRFIRDGGEVLLTNGFDLCPESIVVDFGGYLGDWSPSINENYRPRLYIIEPVDDFCNSLRARFSSFPNVHILPFAIGSGHFLSDLSLAGDATSSVGGGLRVPITFQPFSFLLNSLPSKEIDLASINIEGGEYDLLEVLLSRGYIWLFKTILIQFHDINSDSSVLRKDLQSRLLESHQLTFDYPLVWQRYDRRPPEESEKLDVSLCAR